MTKRTGIFAAAGMVLLGLALLAAGTRRAITLYVDGQPFILYSYAFTAGQALREAGISSGPADSLSHLPNQFLGWNPVITLQRAHQIQLAGPNGLSLPVLSRSRLPGNLLLAAGSRLFPGDRIYWNGAVVEYAAPLPPSPAYTLQIEPAAPVALTENGQPRTFYSAAPSLGGALWQAGIRVANTDDVSAPLGAPLGSSNNVSFSRAVPVTIQVDGREITARSAGESVGQALADAGVSLQGLDYSQPAEGEPVPAGGSIRVVRVVEEVTLEQTTIPFESEYVEDPNTELDQKSIIEPGEYGIQVSRVRVRLEDGKETARQTEAEWTASQPKTQKTGYGTKVVVKTLDTPGGTLEYWRAVNVYATSYSPCRSGTSKCYYYASNRLPVKRGVIGVTLAWYHLLAGQGVYVPGYGQAVVADVGGGVPGKYWIDLGFSDDEFEPWHQDVTLYFLTPVPASVPWILP